MKLVSTLHSGSKFVVSAVMNAGFQDVSMEADLWLKKMNRFLCKYIQCIHEEAIFRAIY